MVILVHSGDHFSLVWAGLPKLLGRFSIKKFKIDARGFLKVLPGFLVVAAYWYWVNKRIISGTDQTFGLLGFFLLMCTATAYFPLPANLLVLGAVKDTEPIMVALVGGFATLAAYASEYLVFSLLFKSKKIADFKDSWLYKQAAPLFDRHKFFILSFASFLPIPSEPLRIYAITKRYPVLLFALSGFTGRIPRYFLLGYYGQDYVNSLWFLAGVFLFPALLLALLKGAVMFVQKIKLRPGPDQLDKATRPTQPKG